MRRDVTRPDPLTAREWCACVLSGAWALAGVIVLLRLFLGALL